MGRGSDCRSRGSGRLREAFIAFWEARWSDATSDNPCNEWTSDLLVGDRIAVERGEYGPDAGPVGFYVRAWEFRHEVGWRIRWMQIRLK